MKSYPLFSETTKLADFIGTNYRLLDILPRLGIGLGFQERTAGQICEEKGISVQVFLLVCNVYTFDDYRPDEQTLKQIPTAELLDFISASHKDYREVFVPKLLARIADLANKSSELHHKVLVDLGNKYRELLFAHMDDEERTEFPYIEALIRGENPARENLFLNTECDYELSVALKDIQGVITKYLSDDSIDSLHMYRDILVDIATFDADTDKHILLEDVLMTLYDKD